MKVASWTCNKCGTVTLETPDCDVCQGIIPLLQRLMKEAETWRDRAQDAANGYTNWAKGRVADDPFWSMSWEKNG